MAQRHPGLQIPTEPYQRQQDNEEGRLHTKLHRIGTHIDVKKGADLASASTLVLGNDGWYFDVTGTNAITEITRRQAGEIVFLQFDAALTLTHDATKLILKTGANVTTTAGDVFVFISEGGTDADPEWRELNDVSVGLATMSVMDFWSEIDNLVTVTSTAANQALKPITVEKIPSGATVNRAVLMLKFRATEDTSGAENSLVLAGTEHIQIDKTGGTYIDAIKLIAGMALTGGSLVGSGDVWIGNIDISSEVDGNDTYETRWEGADCTANNLLFRDVQVGLRLWFR